MITDSLVWLAHTKLKWKEFGGGEITGNLADYIINHFILKNNVILTKLNGL